MLSLSNNNVVEAFNSTSRHLDDLLNIDYSYKQINPTELQLNKVKLLK